MIGTIGSLIGAIILFLFKRGFSWRAETNLKRQEELEAEQKNWVSGNFGKRQGITNKYLFLVLKDLFFANLLLALPTIASVLTAKGKDGTQSYLAFNVVAGMGAVVAFIGGIAKILRYLDLRSLDKTSNDDQI